MFRGSVTELILPCSVEELCHRLNSRMDRSFVGRRPVIGRIRGAKLTARKRIWYRNSFQTYLSAELIEDTNQTLVRCSFSMHPFVIVFMAVWFGGVALFGAAIFIHLLSLLIWPPAKAPEGSIVGAAISFIMLLSGGAALVRLGRWLAADEKAFLLKFVSSAGIRSPNVVPRHRPD
jgi:hypothetical protein